ncbi:MAK10-like protein [Tanacetum coccineum]
MGDENPIRTLGDYSKPSHEGYRNIELPEGNNVVPLRFDTIWLGKNVPAFISISLCDQASNWLKRLPAGSISTWEDLTTRFLAQFFPSGRTAKLRNDILMFSQQQGESISEAWTRFKDLLQKVSHHGIDLCSKNAKESWALLEDLSLYDNESWKDPGDFAKPIKAISLPQVIPSTSDLRLIELENQICNGPYDTQYCMENPEQAFVDYASSRTDEAGGNQSNLEGLVSNFMTSQDARLSKFEADFKQQQSEMTNKIDTVLKAITDRITRILLSDTVKNPKLNVISTPLVLSAPTNKSCDNKSEEEEKGKPENIDINPPSPPDSRISLITKKVCKLNSFLESFRLVPQSPNIKYVCTKEDDGDVMFIEIIKKYIDSREEELEEDENVMEGEMGVENEEDKRRGVNCIISKILGFYKECLELGPEYLTGLEDEGEVTRRDSIEGIKRTPCVILYCDWRSGCGRLKEVFFLATKDETSGILKSFITGIENLVDHKVKVIRCDNGTEFKNRRNESVLLFGCPVTILNTIDHLGKFDGKADEGFFVGYSLNSKAFRVFNSRTRIMEENLHISFNESTPNVVGSGPDWLFDIDALTRTMNYEPIIASTQSNGFAGIKASDNVGQARKETEPIKDYILLPLWTADPPYSQDPKSFHDDGSKPSSNNGMIKRR